MSSKKPSIGEIFVFYVGPALGAVFAIWYLVATGFRK